MFKHIGRVIALSMTAIVRKSAAVMERRRNNAARDPMEIALLLVLFGLVALADRILERSS